MDELCLVIGVLLLVVTVVTLVGHGIWVVAAAILRGLTGGDGGAAGDEAVRAVRQVETLYRQGRIDAETYRRVAAALLDQGPGQGRFVMTPTATPTAMPTAARTPTMPPPVPPPLPGMALGAEAGAAEAVAPRAVVPVEPVVPVARVETPWAAAEAPRPVDAIPEPAVVVPPLPGPLPQGEREQAPPALPASPAPAALPVPPVPAAPPRRRLSEVLARFMEESNIRWGELVGGLLIVGCSIALVVTFREEIAARPWLKYALLTGVTAAVFAAGLYTEHRWKLPNTSRGVLITATLLVPFYFWSLSALTAEGTGGGLAVAGEVAALGLFGYLAWAAGRVLTPRWAGALAFAVVGPAGTLSLMTRQAAGAGPGMVLALAALPGAFYVLGSGWMARRAARALAPDEEDALPDSEDTGVSSGTGASPVRHVEHGRGARATVAQEALLTVGAGTVAAGLSLGVLVVGSGQAVAALRQAAPALALMGMPLLFTGLLLYRRLAAVVEAAGLRTAATAAAILGGAATLGAVAVAWPDPLAVLPAGIVAFGVLTWAALALRVPALHALALPCLMLAHVMAVLRVAGVLGWDETAARALEAIGSASSGLGLMPLAALVALGAEALWRWGRRADAAVVGVVAGLAGGVGLALVSWHGLGRPAGADLGVTWAYAGYALAGVAVALRLRAPWAAWLAAIFGGVAVAQGMVLAYPERARLPSAWLTAALVYASIAAAGALAARVAGARRQRLAAAAGGDDIWPGRPHWIETTVGGPLALASFAASLAAMVLGGVSLVGAERQPDLRVLALQGAWLAGLWLAGAVVLRSAELFSAFQGALAAAACIAVGAVLQTQPWWREVRSPALLDPRVLQPLLCALALLSVAWAAARWAMRRTGLGRELIDVTWPAADRVTTALVLVVGAVLSVSAAGPGVAAELGPDGAALHPSATGVAGLFMLATTLLALLAGLLERFTGLGALGVILLAASAATLGAAGASGQLAAASALRHLLAIVLLAGTAALMVRRSIRPAIERWCGGDDVAGEMIALAGQARRLLLVLTLGPVLAVTLMAAGNQLSGARLSGPGAGSIFAEAGPAANYVLPLAAGLVALVALAVRERSESLSLGTGLLAMLTTALAYALHRSTAKLPMDAVATATLLQLVSITSAAYALAWAGAWAWRRNAETLNVQRSTLNVQQTTDDGPRTADKPRLPPLLLVQVGLAILPLLVLLVPVEGTLLLDPGAPHPWTAPMAGLLGWTACATAFAAAVVAMLLQGGRAGIGLVLAGVVVAGSMAAGTAHHASGGGGGAGDGWFAYRVLLVARALGAWVMLGAALALRARAREDGPGRTEGAVILGAVALGLALRAAWDPGGIAWSIGGIVVVAALGVGLALVTLRAGFLYATGILLNVAATMWWIWERRSLFASEPLGLPQVNVLVLASSGLALLLLELLILRPMRQDAGVATRPYGFHRVAGILSLVGMTLVAGLSLLSDAFGGTSLGAAWLTWGPPAAVLALSAVMLYDLDARRAVGGLWLAGLLAVAMGLHGFHLRLGEQLWAGAMALAGYLLLGGFLFSQRWAAVRTLDGWGVPVREAWPSERPGWLAAATLLGTLLVFLMALAVIFGEPAATPRLIAGVAVVAATVAVGLLAHGTSATAMPAAPEGAAPAPAPTSLHGTTLALALLAAVVWGWSMLTWGTPRATLDHLVIVLAAAGAGASVYGAGLAKFLRRDGAWTEAARRIAPAVGAVAGLALLATLGSELALNRGGRTDMSPWAFAAVAATLVGLAAACIVCAAVPGRDPLDLSERARTGYVYAAELLLVLLFVHAKLVYPEVLRLGIWARFWPLIVMGLAFLGVGLSELFRRQGRRVLAEPLENTAAFLPVLPAATWWALAGTWDHARNLNYAAVLMLAASVYAALSFMRRSFTFGLLAALAANGALWYLLYHTQHFRLAQHPQLWLIPPALCVLIAAQLTRARLPADALRSLRYLCLAVIYVASTIDYWINRESQPWLPLVLAALSVTGVLAGIVLRVQSFLYLGTLFLLVSVIAMIHYAARSVGHVWPWLVAGVVLGAALIVIFALFEKKREQMLAIVEGLKEWQG